MRRWNPPPGHTEIDDDSLPGLIVAIALLAVVIMLTIGVILL